MINKIKSKVYKFNMFDKLCASSLRVVCVIYCFVATTYRVVFCFMYMIDSLLLLFENTSLKRCFFFSILFYVGC